MSLPLLLHRFYYSSCVLRVDEYKKGKREQCKKKKAVFIHFILSMQLLNKKEKEKQRQEGEMRRGE